MGDKSGAVTTDKFLDFISLLDKYAVDYILVGGQAMSAHGFTRFTVDIDILCSDDEG